MNKERFQEFRLAFIIFAVFVAAGLFIYRARAAAEKKEEAILITEYAVNYFDTIHTSAGSLNIPKLLSDVTLTSATANTNKEYIKAMSGVLKTHKEAVLALNEVVKSQKKAILILDKRLKEVEQRCQGNLSKSSSIKPKERPRSEDTSRDLKSGENSLTDTSMEPSEKPAGNRPEKSK